MKAVLCVGGLDPAGRAGILADARAVESCGARPVCVVTALTVQSSQHMHGYEPISVETISKQLELLLMEEAIAAIKVGQLATAEIAELVGMLPEEIPLVLDTPLVSSTGGELFPGHAIVAAYRPLLRRATLVTPNAPEAFLLAGRAPVEGRDLALRAAEELPARAVLLKGGHLPGDMVEDMFLRKGTLSDSYRSPRVPGRFRGTGCRLASAVASRLAVGDALQEAITYAHAWLQRELQREEWAPA